MIDSPRRLPVLLLLAATLALGACSGGPKPSVAAPAAVATAPGDIDAIAYLLNLGEKRAADRRLKKALKSDPMNPSLLVLQQGIDGDAKRDLGARSFEYVVKPGETMPVLAKRFLGNALKSYQLARYNDIAKPSSLAAGQTIRIPGEAPRATPPRRVGPAPAPRPSRPAAAPSAAARPPAATPQAPRRNPAAAQRARSAGLASLNQGKVAAAVTQLRRALALDPGNATIARDLARAERIAATVRSRR